MGEIKEVSELEKVYQTLTSIGERLDKNQQETRSALQRALFYQEPMAKTDGGLKNREGGDDLVYRLNILIDNFQRLLAESEQIRNHANRLA